MFRKGPSEIEIARENEVKIAITQELATALKSVQKENVGTQDQAVYSTDTVNKVCNCIEAVFLHGLKSKAVTKIANYVGLSPDVIAQSSLNFWSFVSRFTHSEVISQLKHLGQITTEIGLCRAWVRVALNDGIMESYLDAMVAEKKTLERHYHRTAYLRDPEQPGIMKTYLQGLMNFEFKLSYNASLLNEWPYSPLLLAGVIDTKDAPPPVIKPAASKPKSSKLQRPEKDPNTIVEVIQEGSRSRGSSLNSDIQGSPSNPMDKLKIGKPSESSYFVSSSEFTSKDVEEFKKLSKKTPGPMSECSSSSHMSAPDPPNMNLSPALYVKKYAVTTGSPSLPSPSNSYQTPHSEDDAISYDGGYDVPASNEDHRRGVAINEDIVDATSYDSQPLETASGNFKQGYTEKTESDSQLQRKELEESWEDFYKDPLKKVQNIDVNFRKIQRLDSINRDAKEKAILNSFVDTEENLKEESTGDLYKNNNSGCESTQLDSETEKDLDIHQEIPEHSAEDFHKQSMSGTQKLLQESEKLLSELGIEDQLTLQANDGHDSAEVLHDATSPVKKKKEKSSLDKLKPELSLSPPKPEIVQPELSNAVADKIDQIRTLENPQYLSKHRLSMPNTGSLRKPDKYGKRKSLPDVLENQILNEVSEDRPDSIEYHLYNGMPLDESEGYSKSLNSENGISDDIDEKEEQEIIRRLGEKRNSVGNNLMMTGRGWSSSFESEGGDTVDAFSPPRSVGSLPISRPKSESFGSLLQNYTPASSLSARSVDDVLSNFPSSKDAVVSPVFSETSEEDQSRMQQFSVIANEKGLDAQNFQCKGCSRAVGLIFGKPRVCKFDGCYYCYECHENDEYYIPALIVHNWDFRKHKVAKKNFEFLTEKEEQPYINIEEVNPRLYDHVDEMREIQGLRQQLIMLKSYLFTCKQSIAEDLRKLVWPRDYLYDSTELYSLADLLQVPSGALASSIKKVIKFATKHVYSCRLCSQKGFICELCNIPKVIYAFEVDSTYRCPQCKTVFHKECKTDNRPCPKCQRRINRQVFSGDSGTPLTPVYDLQTVEQ